MADRSSVLPESPVHIIDESKAFLPDFRHRALRYHAQGIFLCERIFGVALVNSEGKQVPVRYIGEQHVKEDLGRIPTAQDWLSQIKPARWMYGQQLERDDSADTIHFADATGRWHEAPSLDDSNLAGLKR